ncbi:hypothetical protein OG394_00870 [Kribbella sp. NBC_01245]|uniref:hypothetical protein n=1 Tax=Kribbella sp. NBC_01245 TaxID=2903578 RepID=UPI002E2E359C|nr:hypothetical protein [Kribbella sp. NBC_01245]
MTRQSDPHETAEPKVWPRLFYSYFTKTDLVVMRETEIVARVPAPFVPQYRGAVWTTDGRYVATLVDNVAEIESADPEKRELVAVEAATGEVRRLKCRGCTSLTAVGGSEVLASVSDSTTGIGALSGILRADLATTQAPVSLSKSVAVDGVSLTHAMFVAGTAGKALLMGIDRHERNAFYFYDRQGRHRLSGTTTSPRDSARFVSDAGAVAIGNELRVAVGSSVKASGYECAELGAVDIHSSNGSAMVNTRLADISDRSDKPGVTSMVGTRDLWWESDGELHATAYAGRCVGTPKMTTQPTEWKFHDGRWSQVSKEPRWQVRPLGRAARLLLLPQPTFADQNELVLEANGRRVLIAPDVVAIAAAPPSTEVADCVACEFVVDAGYREPARKPSPGRAAFVGTWSVHGWEVHVRANQVATSRRWRVSCVRPFNEDCLADLTYAVAIDAGARTMRLTLKSVRYAINDGNGGAGRPVEHPVFESQSDAYRIGETSTYRWVRPGLIKDITVPPEAGNPYLCSSQHPPQDARECGA